MDSERWEQIQTLFHEALNRPDSERPAYLEAACDDDADLMAEVETMLKADSRTAPLLDRGLADVAHRILSAPLELAASQAFGPYRLKRILGEGGMGVVWLAEREDAGNLVAIKLLPHAGLSPVRRDRFAHEIKTLGKLKHPFIARLYDAGMLTDGTPWFVMEFVEGARFTEYCREHDRPIGERLQLFRKVCEAVQYAHGQEIIHRDLKPSNILVEVDGTPRLLDFGIARELQSLDEPSDQTRPGLRFMSPDYAAPEWARDGSVGFYTDVYSLGVILYEMLAGRLPLRRAPEDQITKPSAVQAAAGSSSLGKTAQADLDVLCLKAMHSDAHQRYQSVEAFIRDIDHFLKGEPLEARPDSVRYRVGKFVTRNRRAVLAASLAIMLVAGLVIFFTMRLARARDTALAEAARSQRVEKFMQKLIEGGDEEAGPSEDLRVVTLLDRGTRDAQALSADPAIQAQLYQTLGTAYQALGKFERADAPLNSALKQQVSTFGPDHQEVAGTLLRLGLLRMDQSQLADSEHLIRESLAMNLRHLSAAGPAVAASTVALGSVMAARGSYEKSIEVLEKAVRLLSVNSGSKTELLASLTLLANSHFYLGHYAIADSLDRRILAMDQQMHGENHPDVADDLVNLGHIQTQWGRYVEAEQYYRRALAITQSWHGKDHPEAAAPLTYVAQALNFQGRYSEAGDLLRQGLVILNHAYGVGPHSRVALAILELGRTAQGLGNLDEAEADFARAAEMYRSVYGSQHQATAQALSSLAGVYLRKRQYARAEPIFRDTIQRLTKAQGANHFNTGRARIEFGGVLLGEKRYLEAEQELLAGYAILMKQTSPEISWLKTARQELVTVYGALNQPQKEAKFRAELVAIN